MWCTNASQSAKKPLQRLPGFVQRWKEKKEGSAMLRRNPLLLFSLIEESALAVYAYVFVLLVAAIQEKVELSRRRRAHAHITATRFS